MTRIRTTALLASAFVLAGAGDRCGDRPSTRHRAYAGWGPRLRRCLCGDRAADLAERDDHDGRRDGRGRLLQRRPAGSAELNEPKAITVLLDLQGFLVADAANSRIRLVSTDLRRTLQVRLATHSLRARAGAQVALAFDLSDPATARLEVRAARRTFVRLTAKAPRGRNVFRFGRSLRPGRYVVVVRAASTVDRPVQATASLQIVAR